MNLRRNSTTPTLSNREDAGTATLVKPLDLDEAADSILPAYAPKPQKQLPLGQQLVRAGIVTNTELESALSEQSNRKLRLGEMLLEMGFVEEEALLPFLAGQICVPAVRLREGLIDPNVVKTLPRATAERFPALALFDVRGTLTVALGDPQNLDHIDEIERVTGKVVNPVFALNSSIVRMLPRAYENDFGVDTVTADLDVDAVTVESEAIEIDLQQVGSLADGSPVINLVNYMIVHAVRQKASDIHIEPGIKHSAVRFRVDGSLREVLRPRKEFHPALISRLKVMAKLDIAEHRLPQDGRIHVLAEGREIDLRISTLPTVRGEKVVLRVLDRSNVTFNMDQLGINAHELSRIKSMLARPYGLMLVTGPTGSGKTTTLYSALELVKSVERNIVTVEDPVEYQLELINQIQVGASKQMSFANALRSILRQDPDILMVGEIRDKETAEVAIQAALTGHLVLSTLHTNDSASAVTRLLDMGVESFKIGAALVGVVAQRLVRTICSNCRAEYFPTPELLDQIRYTGDRSRQFVKGEGCKSCYDTGFKGRVGIYEVLVSNREMRELISREPDLEKIRKCHIDGGGQTLLDHGLQMVEEGVTSIDEVIRVSFFD
jgi:type IV pilus assembly protein PilB